MPSLEKQGSLAALKALTEKGLTLKLLNTDGNEVTGAGYQSVSLVPANWTTEGDSLTYPAVTFSSSGPWGRVWGYGLYLGELCIGKESFVNNGGPYNVRNDGDRITVTPTLV